ncbi:MAG: PASTA domain-containing protein [Candidatus Krumholzibacteriota bacterium]|nr:PASTA domain-containing protein [Candidatus Krumholzibacteriota bacterium]
MTLRFQKWRLTVVSVFFAIIVCLLFYRIIQIQILRHEMYSNSARGQWHWQAKWPARRGTIYDRNGLPLAVTHKTYTLGVTPRDFPPDEEAHKYLASILNRKPEEIRRILERKESYIFLEKDLCLTGEQEALLSSLSGVKLDPVSDRLYPFGSVTPQFIGSVNDKGVGTGGVELAFQDYLRGDDGWILVNRDARDRVFRPLNAPGREPRNGNDLYLSLDSRVQVIVDFELGQAVERYGAAGGVALVIDSRDGDLLALAERCNREKDNGFPNGSKRALYSTSCIYEPGSTFKLITDAFLLEKGVVGPYDVFYGENGSAQFDFGSFSDEHPRAWLTFKHSFVFSNNICTIKAVMDSDPRDFYDFILRFGFGGRTGIGLPAESKGKLRPPEEWSARSLPSIAIGQEIGVTTMQMAMAYCSLANGGNLLVPRVALRIEDGKDKVVKEFPPIKVRRVLSPETVKLLTEFCRDVVKEGTGKNAAVEGLPVAGKTGTAQKADRNGYIQGKYVASFIGFAPVKQPRLVCLVILDEPEDVYHYGASSSAIVFRKIVEGINLSTDLLANEENSMYAVGKKEKNKTVVPSFFRLKAAEAQSLASSCGLFLKFNNQQGVVYAQEPGPGTLVDDNEEVHLAFHAPSPATIRTVRVPDLRGLSIRKARRMLLECGLKSIIRGYGTVQEQDPSPGREIKTGSEVILNCNPRTHKRGVGNTSLALQRE